VKYMQDRRGNLTSKKVCKKKGGRGKKWIIKKGVEGRMESRIRQEVKVRPEAAGGKKKTKTIAFWEGKRGRGGVELLMMRRSQRKESPTIISRVTRRGGVSNFAGTKTELGTNAE